ncbi:DUF370 domain-containing protein [Pullulanibacillus sp. KACC 23026]|uniref:extracellular matrix regulator RemB n=1 Tax=Pullulanibacillus sp. KACC 23026 TaxID=3028315 RepID=UPI0023AE876C|nr:extracellular matrix/biofilm biosynthesis regulator RemA family protein [Pullulanibacillus sp. KACC 23026]WEG12779.1 DUF370 domain-containing protein [Pullulanibacillus sp. KACC 23026]
MYIHLGEDLLIKTSDIIAIFDFGLIEENSLNQLFIESSIEKHQLIDIGGKQTKSIIITTDCIYFSPFTSSTLKKRSEMGWIQDSLF